MKEKFLLGELRIQDLRDDKRVNAHALFLTILNFVTQFPTIGYNNHPYPNYVVCICQHGSDQ